MHLIILILCPGQNSTRTLSIDPLPPTPAVVHLERGQVLSSIHGNARWGSPEIREPHSQEDYFLNCH